MYELCQKSPKNMQHWAHLDPLLVKNHFHSNYKVYIVLDVDRSLKSGIKPTFSNKKTV